MLRQLGHMHVGMLRQLGHMHAGMLTVKFFFRDALHLEAPTIHTFIFNLGKGP